ncbi:MAG: flippase-like domain-containing protein [Candidatus Delongbacteria bacterium]|nr:flippase-like domain-containing protein [Candidatus Delongbacteria bacterium]
MVDKIKNNKTLIISVKIAISIAIAWAVIYNVDKVELKYILQNAKVKYIFYALLLLPLNLYFQFLKWKYAAQKAVGEKIPHKPLWLSVFLGIALGFVTPGRVGELGKLFALREQDKLKLLSMSMIEKIYDTFPVIIFGSFSLAFLPTLFFTDSSLMRANLMLFSFLIAILFYFIAVHPGLFRSIVNYIRLNLFKKSSRFERFSAGLDGLKNGTARILLLLSTMLFFVYTAQFVLLIFAFGQIDVFHAFAGVWTAVLLKTFLPVSLGDIGVREGTAAYVFSLLGFPIPAAVSAAFMLFAINILMPTIGGLFMIPFTFRQKKNEKEVIE